MQSRFQSVRDRIEDLEVAELNLEAALKLVRQVCDHRNLIECEYWEFGLAPRRLCVDCGAEEEGWHCGYQELKGATTKVSRDTLYRHRMGKDLYLVGQSKRGEE